MQDTIKAFADMDLIELQDTSIMDPAIIARIVADYRRGRTDWCECDYPAGPESAIVREDGCYCEQCNGLLLLND